LKKSSVLLVAPMKVKPLFSPLDQRKVVDTAELSELSGIKISTLREWVRRGEVGGAFRTKEGVRWQFRREALEQWWRELHQESAV
jgi:excisionase family DNA binding protein